MIFWGALLVASGALAAFWSDIRGAVLALWVCGLAAGGMFLSMGSELLAVIEWIVCTVTTITFIFYSITFGEFGVSDDRPLGARLLSSVLPVMAGTAFAAVIWAGLQPLSTTLPEGALQILPNQEIGKSFVHDHFLAVELLALFLFSVMIGAGVIARPEDSA